MKICPNCSASVNDNALFCTKCGCKLDAVSADSNNNAYINAGNPDAYSSNNTEDYRSSFSQPPYNNANGFDHTHEFSAEDVAENKLFALLCYVGGIIGVIVAILMKKESSYLEFHIRQSLKISVIEMLCVLPCVLLSWLVIPVFIVLIPICILVVIRIISFVKTAQGKSLEPEIIKKIDFLK